MPRPLTLLAMAVATGLATTAQAQSTDLLTTLKPYMINGQLDVPALRAALEAAKARSKPVSTPADSAPEASAKAAPASSQKASPRPFEVLLRDSFSDVSIFAASNAGSAKGASISFSRDQVKGDSDWTIKGVVFAPFSISASDGTWLGLAIAPYLGANIDKHSATKTSNTESYDYGLSAEFGAAAGDLDNYVRVSLGGVDDRIAKQTDVTLKGEYLPVVRNDSGDGLCIGTPCGLAGLPLIYALQPDLVVEYDQATGAQHVSAFSGRRDALLIAPEATLNLHPFGPGMRSLSRLHLQVTYRWSDEIYSGRKFTWLDAALGYNLDAAGHLALSASADRGDDEDTALFTKTYRISLTAKF